MNNKRIAKNTIFLYFRMMLIMFVTLYTSRITLKVLGVDDYGIYQTVGGVATFLAFISNALATGTSRFITFEMGKEDSKLETLFSTVRIAHIIIGLAIVFIGEIVGIWFIKNKLVIPIDRVDAAMFSFHLSMLTIFFQVTQVPYNAIIIAYERMNIYAIISIAEAGLKLAIVFMLNIIMYDKLEVYAALYGLVTIIIMVFYRIYCRHYFVEVKARLVFDRNLFVSVASFSGWSLITSSASSFANQGVTIVTNMFFSPAVVTVRTLALTVNKALNQFVGSFRTAVNPQIVKKYAAADYEGSKQLALSSTKYSFYLMLIMVLPLYLLVEPVLTLWLGDIPNGTIPFVKLALVQGLFQAFDTSLYAPIFAKGQIKENAIICSLFDFLQLPIIYVLFKLEFAPIALAWVEAFACIALGIVIKPILVKHIIGYSLKETYSIILQSFIVALVSLVVPLIVTVKVGVTSIYNCIIILCTALFSVVFAIWFLGLDKSMRDMIIVWIKSFLYRKKSNR